MPGQKEQQFGVAALALTALLSASSLAVSAVPVTAATRLQYGGAVIAGGHYDQGYEYYLKTVEVVDTYILPDLLASVCRNTLTAVGPVLYSCGGSDSVGDTANCFSLDTSTTGDLQWHTSNPLPMAMSGHTAVAVGSHIWFFYQSIYDFDTETKKFMIHQPPFVITPHCSVSNGSHAFVFGVGADYKYNEIWTTTTAYSASSWVKVGEITFRDVSEGIECLWIDDDSIILTGVSSGSSSYKFDVQTYGMTKLGDLHSARQSHGMFVWNGKPTVAGGVYGGTYLSSIETLDLGTRQWTNSSRTLDHVKSSFGVAQFLQ